MFTRVNDKTPVCILGKLIGLQWALFVPREEDACINLGFDLALSMVHASATGPFC